MPVSRSWPVLLLALGLFGDRFFFCGTATVALAVAAAYALPARRALLLVGAVWALGQLVGFTVGHFPHAPSTVAWGLALGGAAALAVGVARPFATRTRRPVAPSVAVAFAVAFVVYEAALLAFGLALGEGTSAFAPAIVLAVLRGNVLFGLVLLAARALLELLPLGAPASART